MSTRHREGLSDGPGDRRAGRVDIQHGEKDADAENLSLHPRRTVGDGKVVHDAIHGRDDRQRV